MGNDEYKCARCKNIYTKGRDDDIAIAESEAKFGMSVSEETHDVICDDCFQLMFKN